MPAQSLTLFRRLGGSGFGRWLYARLICWRAPYFASIGPTIEVLEPGRCVARIAHRRRVHNHIGTVHAIALCNLAELTAGLVTDASIPDRMRWIPKGMTVRYLKKAAGTMRATATFPATTDDGVAREVVVAVVVNDPAGETVFDAAITMWVAPRKATA